MSSAGLAFVAGLGTGYFNAEGKKKEEERQAERDRRQNELQDMQIATARQGQQDRADLQAAGAPVAVTPMQGPKTAAQIAAEGASFDPAQPAQGEELGYIAGATLPGARGFAQKGVAEDYAATQATPEARRGRMATLAAQGNVLAGTALRDETQLRAATLQGDAAQLGIKKAEREEADQIFDRGAQDALTRGGPEALAEFLSASKGDGQDGNMRFRSLMAPDGRSFSLMRENEHGTAAPFGRVYTRDDKGYNQALMDLSRVVPLKEKVAHTQAIEKAEADRAHQQGTLRVAQQQADTQERYRLDQAANMRQQRALEERRVEALREKQSAGGGTIQIGIKDLRDFESDVDTYLREKHQLNEGMKPEERQAVLTGLGVDRAMANATFRRNAAIGTPLTAGTVVQAMAMYADKANIRVVEVNGAVHDAVMVGGVPVIMSGPLQKKESPPKPQAGPPTPAQFAKDGLQSPTAGTPIAQAPKPEAPASPEAQALDHARVAVSQANSRLQAWGSAKRQRDPAGYQQAQREYEQAKASEQAAMARYQTSLPTNVTSPARAVPGL